MSKHAIKIWYKILNKIYTNPQTHTRTLSWNCFFLPLQNRIAISLISMLVHSALFSQSSQSIPRTSFFKRIDVWYDMLIIIGFLIIIVHVCTENLCCRQPLSHVNVIPVEEYHLQDPQGLQVPRTRTSLAVKLNTISQIMFPLLCTGLCVTIIAVGAHPWWLCWKRWTLHKHCINKSLIRMYKWVCTLWRRTWLVYTDIVILFTRVCSRRWYWISLPLTAILCKCFRPPCRNLLIMSKLSAPQP